MATSLKVATPDSVNLTNNAEALAALARWRELKAIEAAGEAAKRERQNEVEAVIRAALGGAGEGIVRGIVAVKKSSPRKNTSIDAKLLLEGYPEAYAATERVTHYDFLTVS